MGVQWPSLFVFAYGLIASVSRDHLNKWNWPQGAGRANGGGPPGIDRRRSENLGQSETMGLSIGSVPL
jgi:hypothetical protein